MRRGVSIASIAGLLVSLHISNAVADEANAKEATFAVVRSLPMDRGADPMSMPYLTKQELTARQSQVRTNSATPTAKQTQEAKKPTPQIYAVDSSKYSSTVKPMADPSDPVFPPECVNYFLDNDPPNRIWLKNRFASCHAEWVIVEFFKKNSTLPVGRAVADWALTINMPWNARETLIKSSLTNWRFVGETNTSLSVGVEIGCFGAGIPGSTARCQHPEWGWAKSITGWQADGEDDHTFQFQGEDPPNPGEPSQIVPEKRTLYSIASYAYGYGGPGPWEHYGQTEQVSVPLRCDIVRNSNPQYAKSSDCVFHGATGWLKFAVADPDIAESAQLIYDAHQDFDKTYPGGGLGKYIPGNAGLPEPRDKTEPLTRSFYDTNLRRNNHDAAVKACKANWGPDYTKRDDGQVNECDEFPFQTTYEGAFTVTPGMLRTFAVRPVLRQHNGEAGSRWGSFLAQDHILDGDATYATAYK